MDGERLAHRRMHNLRLAGPPCEAPGDVVRWLGAVQSQDYGPAKWSVAERTGGVGDAAVDQAFADGAILRTHVLRPTWHFVAPADIRWMLELTGPRVHALNRYYYRQFELDDAVLERSTALLVSALQGGTQRTRKELEAELERAGIATGRLRTAYILMHAELNGVICSGALKGKQHTYALLEERAAGAQSLAYEEALAELTRRYFTSHGPATAKDFRWWSSLTLAEISKGLETAAAHLEREVIDGVTYWSAESGTPAEVVSPTVHLLQGYDEYVVGYSESKWVLDVSGAARSLSTDKVIFNGVLILDSQVAGHWKRTVRSNGVVIEAALYAPLDEAQTAALHGAASRHGAFLGLPATVATTTI